MKIQIDTDLKTIKLEHSENLGKIFDLLEKMVENWREYKLELTDIVIVESFPTIIYRERNYWPYIPLTYPGTTNPYIYGPSFTTTNLNASNTSNNLGFTGSSTPTGTGKIIDNTGLHNLELD